MKSVLIVSFSFVLALQLCFAQNYEWPLMDVSSKDITGTFCEYRSDHLHEGIDIPESFSNDVVCAFYPCLELGAYKVVKKEYDVGWYVTVQHYLISTDFTDTTLMYSGSRYLHLSDEPNLQVNKIYLRDTLIAMNTEFEGNHLHFEIRMPQPESLDYNNSYNPFGEDMGLCTSDTTKPCLDFLYVDADSQGDATISPWNFLHYNFNNYYDSTTAAPFIQCLLPQESINNDLDDPHFLVSDMCAVRFVLKAKDKAGDSSSTNSTLNCAPYLISLYLDTDLTTYPLDTIPFSEDASPFYGVRFDELLNNDEDEKHDEEDVYHTEEPLQSHIAQNPNDTTRLYFRLYPYDKNNDGLPSCIITDTTILRTENLDEGIHRIRIYARDYATNYKTADAHFYIRRSDWIDFCRGFKE